MNTGRWSVMKLRVLRMQEHRENNPQNGKYYCGKK